MDSTSDATRLDPNVLQSLLGESAAPSLIPESLVTTMIVSFVVLNVLGVLFLIFYVIGMVRKWKVQSAVLSMQKDIVEIKALLGSDRENTHTTQPPTVQTPPQPGDSNRIIAADTNESKAV